MLTDLVFTCYLLWFRVTFSFLPTYVIHLKHHQALSLLPEKYMKYILPELQVFHDLMTSTLYCPVSEHKNSDRPHIWALG